MNEFTTLTITLYVFAAVFGACIGSFINVVIARLPIKGAFLSNSRSKCSECNSVLKLYDLIPIFSWLILGGKCRSCKVKISPRYSIIELMGAVFAVFCLYHFWLSNYSSLTHIEQLLLFDFANFNFAAIIAYGVIMILIAVSVIDYNTSEIPDSLIITLIPFAIVSIWLFPDVTLLSRIIGFFSIALPMFLICMLVSGAFGGGDIKLMAVCGFFLGWQLSLVAFFIALIAGGVVAVYFMASGKRKKGQHMVFGPALCIGITLALFYGNDIIRFYLGLFGIW